MHSEPLIITSPVFSQGGLLPAKYTCDAENISPPLDISGVPPGTKTLSIILTDLDSHDHGSVHWVIWNIPPVSQVEEDFKTGVQGLNDFSRYTYFGPCPDSGIYRYKFQVYAVDTAFSISQYLTGAPELAHAMEGHILSAGEIVCKYERESGL